MKFEDRVAKITAILSIEYDGSIPEIELSFRDPVDGQLAGHHLFDLIQAEEEKCKKRILHTVRDPVPFRMDERTGRRFISDSEFYGVDGLLDLPDFGLYVYDGLLGICFSTGPEWTEKRVATLIRLLDALKVEHRATVQLDPEQERFCDEHIATFNACFDDT